MARKPNHQFERMEHQRAKDAKAAAKAAAKRGQDKSPAHNEYTDKPDERA